MRVPEDLLEEIAVLVREEYRMLLVSPRIDVVEGARV
jgi:hypothetical protein